MIIEKPILFNAEMVRAILDGRKTMTRRVIKNKNFIDWVNCGFSDQYIKDPSNLWHEHCPYGRPGTRLWVRETWAKIWNQDGCLNSDQECPDHCPGCHYEYKADTEDKYPGEWPDDCGDDLFCPKWKPSIYMPRKASRINLEIMNIGIERLQDISSDDCWREGVSNHPDAFRKLWDSINAKRGYSWESNPFVWVIEFKRIR